MNELKQKKNFSKREFKITNSKLIYKQLNFGNVKEVEIPFENFSGARVTHQYSNILLMVIAIGFYFIAISLIIGIFQDRNSEFLAAFIFAIIGSIFFGIYIITRENFWKIGLTTERDIFIHKTIPNTTSVNHFLSTLLETRNEYLKENYAVLDEYIDYERQLQNLKWLKSINAISKEEFDEKYKELKLIIKPSKNNIGFSN